MKRSDRLAAFVAMISYAAFGGAFGKTLLRLASLNVDPEHYRVTGALAQLRWLPQWPPVAWMAACAALGFVMWWIGWSILRRQGVNRSPEAALLPFFAVVLGAALLLFAGDPVSKDTRFWVLAGVGFAGAGQLVLWALIALWPLVAGAPWTPRLSTVWAISILFYVTVGMWMTRVQEPTGDEPHYLLGMHSLVVDGDLDVANNHLNQDYLAFYPTPLHHAQMIETKRGITLPKHSIGLMVLGAPCYWIGGREAVSLFCSLLLAALAAVVYTLMAQRHGSRASAVCWSIMLVSAPLAIYPGQIYPNALTGLLLAGALLYGRQGRWAVLSGLMLGLIPWCHLGTWPLALGALFLLTPQKLRQTPRLWLPAVLLWAFLGVYHLYFWGSLTPPVSTYGRFSWAGIPRALPGLFLDQESGIFWLAPIWLTLIPGLRSAVRTRQTRREFLLLAMWLLYLSTFSWWYGGWCPTGRFFLPVSGLLASLLCLGVPRLRRGMPWLWVVSGSVTFLLISFPFFRYNAHDGTNSMLDALGHAGSCLAAFFPRVVEFSLPIWLAWVGFLTGLIWLLTRRSDQ